jgi:hypothetical protein
MALGVPRRGRIGWMMWGNGGQKPAVSVEGGGTAACLIPPWYVDADAAACGPLQVDVAPRVAAMLMQAPAIEAQQVVALRGRLAERLIARSDLLPAVPSRTMATAPHKYGDSSHAMPSRSRSTSGRAASVAASSSRASAMRPSIRPSRAVVSASS